MKTKRNFRFVASRAFDERDQAIQLLVIRDAFVAILLMAVLLVIGLAFFPLFITANLPAIGGGAIIIVGLVAWISNRVHGGRSEEQKVALAKGELLSAPFVAAFAAFLIGKFSGEPFSLIQWLLLFAAMLSGFLAYPLFVLAYARKHTPISDD